jgi:hypothetical protein
MFTKLKGNHNVSNESISKGNKGYEMAASIWVLLYTRPITKEEMKVVEELRRIEGQEVYLVYLYDSN